MDHANAKLRILVVDDHPLFRAGVITVVNSQPDMVAIAQAGDGQQAIELYREHHPDVVLMDLRMPGLGGVDATSLIISEHPAARVLVITTFRGDVEALRALKAGALGYLLKTTLLDELPIAIRHLAEGRRYLPNEIAEGLATHAIDEPLTLREIAVLKSVASGKSNQLVARELAISEETVKCHMKGIMSKLDARDRTHAVCIGFARGIITD